MQENNYYKIGLPSSIRFRAQIIFGLLLILFLSFSVSGVYAGVKTGRFEKVLVEPVASFIESLGSQADNLSTGREEYSSFNASSSSEVNIDINSQDSDNRIPSDRQYNTPYAYPSIKYKSYEEIKKEQDEWWAQVQEQNKQLSEQSRRDIEQFRIDSQIKLNEFKKEGQQGLEQFQKESQQKMEEFKQKYGIQ